MLVVRNLYLGTIIKLLCSVSVLKAQSSFESATQSANDNGNESEHLPILRICSNSNKMNSTTMFDLFTSKDELSTTYFLASSRKYVKKLVTLNCPRGHVKQLLPFTRVSLLNNGDIMHLRNKDRIPASLACYKVTAANRKYIRMNFDVSDSMEVTVEVCQQIPKAPLCCSKSKGLFIRHHQNIVCKISKDLPTRKEISFNGSRQWTLPGTETGIPHCPDHMSLAVIEGDINVGSLRIRNYGLEFNHVDPSTEEPIVRNIHEYCLGQMKEDGVVKPVSLYCAKRKLASHCLSPVCYGKCCPDGQIYNVRMRVCQIGESNIIWNNKITEEDLQSRQIVYGMPRCETKGAYIFIRTFDNGDFYVKSNGRVVFTPFNLILGSPKYCMDFFYDESKFYKTVVMCRDDLPWKVQQQL